VCAGLRRVQLQKAGQHVHVRLPNAAQGNGPGHSGRLSHSRNRLLARQRFRPAQVQQTTIGWFNLDEVENLRVNYCLLV
jgi:hypothetical protein